MFLIFAILVFVNRSLKIVLTIVINKKNKKKKTKKYKNKIIARAYKSF